MSIHLLSQCLGFGFSFWSALFIIKAIFSFKMYENILVVICFCIIGCLNMSMAVVSLLNVIKAFFNL